MGGITALLMLLGGSVLYVKNNVYPLLFTNYKLPVVIFARGMEIAEEALVVLDGQVTEAYVAVQRKYVLERDKLLMAYEGDCMTGSERCRLAAADKDGEEDIIAQSPLGNTIAVMRSIGDYAESLVEIVNADNAKEVETLVNATLGGLQLMGETSGWPEFKAPVANPFNWIFGQDVTAVQFMGLSRVTKEAKPVIARTASIFEEASNAALGATKAAMAQDVTAREHAVAIELTESAVDQLIASAAAYDELLLADLPTVYVRLREAHDALADKLQDQSHSMVDLMAKLEAFLNEAETLRAVLLPLRAATERNLQDQRRPASQRGGP